MQLCKVRVPGGAGTGLFASASQRQIAPVSRPATAGDGRGATAGDGRGAGGLPVTVLFGHPSSCDSRLFIDDIILRHCRVFVREAGKVFAAYTAQPGTG